ncbi:sugar ABC transporter ATP-binding protein [Agromyces aerolatus]|uniref:sugar ABC transporter ATP-binding protein n=1 Tax=Agromyces sp. LY-1074 TaxID=3074080 RepID=UPI00285D74A9|nr:MULTISPECIES: sugar ABC transporter ATP-binding protein [unclassified Agromyces]MDR5699474.1 sugar ABC transporter ATP-binding protein [Agromyces sp. LY-1074]MDR5705770.1 sugar ABC transporter ATP-binding protein [Agromyces sp. LY-1358]
MADIQRAAGHGEVVLAMSGITKTFPGVRALTDVSLELKRGEVHALMGENGAGKSTLLKILSGLYQPDRGAVISLDGEDVSFKRPRDAQNAGISTIYQELDLVPQLPTYENIFIGREPRRFGAVSHRRMIRDARALFDRLGVAVDVRKDLGEQSPAVQQLTSIARALELRAKVVVMDEATSSLDADETELLFRIVRELKSSGVAVVFVSHRLSEVYEICDRITLLRDGELVGTFQTAELSEYDLVTKMVGHPVDPEERHPMHAGDTAVVLEGEGITTSTLDHVSLALRSGEVTGLAGLLGSGRTEVARALFGADPITAGDVRMRATGHPKRWSIRRAIRDGIAYTPEERRSDGIFPNMSVLDNITIAALKEVSTWGVINSRKQRRLAQSYVERFRIKTPTLEHPISKLSGGNQQKAILARWLATNPTVLMLDEPTRGIDVGAKAEVERLIRELAGAGIAVLFISSELPELLRNSTRIVVLRDGAIIRRVNAEDADQELIMAAIAGSDEPQHAPSERDLT